MPVIAFVGDTHYRFYEMYDWLIELERRSGTMIDAIVHVGDFGIDLTSQQWNHLWTVDKQVPIETYVNPGNHENIDSIMQWKDDPKHIERLHLLPDGGVTEVAGIKIASVWGNYSPISWNNPDRVKYARDNRVARSKRAMHIYKPSVENLAAYDGAVDVLITHDTSSIVVPTGFLGRPIPDFIVPQLGLESSEKNALGCPGFNQLIHKFKPKYYFYGHFHKRDYQEWNGTKVFCLNAFDYNKTEAVEIVDFIR